MRFGRLDLNLLVALDALIEHRSVSGAASQLCLTQPALSGALNRLRDYFEDDLLVQSGRRMLLTAKAEQLAEPVRSALMIIRSTITTPKDFDPAVAERHFVIAASDYAFNVLLADTFAEAFKVAPGISFEITPSGRLMNERLERGEVDLTMSIGTYLLKEHPRATLFDDEHAVVCWSEGKFRDGITAEQFFDAQHAIAYFGADRQPAFTETYFTSQGVQRKIALRLPNFAALPQAVIGTQCVATMYRRHAEFFARSLAIRVHQIPVPMPRIVEEVQWHSMRDKDEGLEWLVGRLRASAKRLQPETPPSMVSASVIV